MSGKPNDTAMLKEVLERRFGHYEWKLPDLILIDGGVGQLSAALKIKIQNSKFKMTNQNSKIKRIKFAAIAKRKNELYLENKKSSFLLKELPQDVSNLILRILDESHRFAISYHKKLRKRTLFEN
jgi:excinuclease ABC subunit C